MHIRLCIGIFGINASHSVCEKLKVYLGRDRQTLGNGSCDGGAVQTSTKTTSLSLGEEIRADSHFTGPAKYQEEIN